MKNKLAVITTALALFYIGGVTAAETVPWLPPTPVPPGATTAAEQTAPNPAIGFGSGSGMGPGGGVGSPTSLTGGPGSPVGNSGGGSQTFGGGLPGTGPLSTPPAAGAGGPLGP